MKKKESKVLLRLAQPTRLGEGAASPSIKKNEIEVPFERHHYEKLVELATVNKTSVEEQVERLFLNGLRKNLGAGSVEFF